MEAKKKRTLIMKTVGLPAKVLLRFGPVANVVAGNAVGVNEPHKHAS